jgi:aryl-alcohol dehydrogenase-like predicted oxidoreductase
LRSLGYWLRSHGSFQIPGTKKLERLQENIGAAAVELTSVDLREIDSAASKITVQGARHPEHLERLSETLSATKP